MRSKRIILFSLLIFLSLGLFMGYKFISKRWNQKAVALNTSPAYFYIPTDATYQDVLNQLQQKFHLNDPEFFDILADYKHYKNKVKAGRYLLSNKLNNNQLINMLRSGNQAPINFTFNNIRFLPKLAGIAGKKLELDSAKLMQLLRNDSLCARYGFKPQTIISMFIPNSYQFFWNTNEMEFLDRMKKEYGKFWNQSRLNKAKALQMSPIEVSILASIIQEETNKTDEMPRMAGALINRLKRGIKLQADPTARFANGNFDIRRIPRNYTEIDSPYNTYKVQGLPPGPITMPHIQCIDAVLNYEHHHYIFYCAKADGSGYHAFAKTNREHNRNARAYHRYLNKRRIYR